MRQSPKTASGQFTLALHREPTLPLDPLRKEELRKALAELLLEALGVEAAENPDQKEKRNESQDHA